MSDHGHHHEHDHAPEHTQDQELKPDLETARTAGILRILASWKEDGRPLVSKSQLRKVAAVYVMKRTSEEASFDTRIRKVGLIHEIATLAGDSLLGGTVSKVLQGLRLIASGRRPKDWERTLEQLSRWAQKELAMPAILQAGVRLGGLDAEVS